MKNEMLIAMERGPGTQQKRLTMTREGIKREAAVKVFAESVGQMIRANRPVIPEMLAEEAWKCAEAFAKEWDKQGHD